MTTLRVLSSNLQLTTRISMNNDLLVSKITRFRTIFCYLKTGIRRLIGLANGLAITRVSITTIVDVCRGVSKTYRASNMACLRRRFINGTNDCRVLNGITNYVDYTTICLEKILSKRDTTTVNALTTMNVCSGLTSHRPNIAIEAASCRLTHKISIMYSAIIRRYRRLFVVSKDGSAQRRGLSCVPTSLNRRFLINLRLNNVTIINELCRIIILNKGCSNVSTCKYTIIVVFSNRLTLNIKARMNRRLTFTASVYRRLRSTIYGIR